MTWLDFLAPLYLAGMVVFTIHGAERARENRINDPTLALLPYSHELRVLAAVYILAMSPAWPLFAVLAALAALGRASGALADRLRQ